MLRYLRDASLRVTAANHEFCGGQFEINLVPLRPPRRRRPGLPDEVRGAGDRPSRGDARHLHGQAVQRRGRQRLPPPRLAGRRRGDNCSATPRASTDCRRPAGSRSAACSLTRRRWPHPEPDDQLLQALRARHPRAVADRLGAGQPQRDGPDPARAWVGVPDGGPARRRDRQPLPGDRRGRCRDLPRGPRQGRAAGAARGLRLRPGVRADAAPVAAGGPRRARGRHRAARGARDFFVESFLT